MDNEPLLQKFWRFVNTHQGGGLGVAVAAIIVVIIAQLVNILLLLTGYGDLVPAKFHWLEKLFFWR